jgi:uncharacterized membrane protein
METAFPDAAKGLWLRRAAPGGILSQGMFAMYKKLARISPISFGIFYAVFTLLMMIVAALVGIFVLPNIPRQPGIPEFDMFESMSAQVLAGEGLVPLATSIGMVLAMSFVIGVVLAIFYNLVAMVTGGIKVKTHDLGYDDF